LSGYVTVQSVKASNRGRRRAPQDVSHGRRLQHPLSIERPRPKHHRPLHQWNLVDLAMVFWSSCSVQHRFATAVSRSSMLSKCLLTSGSSMSGHRCSAGWRLGAVGRLIDDAGQAFQTQWGAAVAYSLVVGVSAAMAGPSSRVGEQLERHADEHRFPMRWRPPSARGCGSAEWCRWDTNSRMASSPSLQTRRDRPRPRRAAK
jgi:hypothetical protein